MLATMRTRPEGEGRVIEDNQYPGVRKKESEEFELRSKLYLLNKHPYSALFVASQLT